MTTHGYGEADRPRLLLVEDNPGDVDLLKEHLGVADDDAPDLDVAGTLAEARERLDERDYTAVLLDLNLPDSTGLSTVERMVRYAPSTPIIVLTGSGVEELGTGALARGAADFIPKEEVSGHLLLRSVRYALERHRRLRAETRYRALIENSRDLVVVLDREFSIRYLSPSVAPILGYEPEEKLGADASLDVHPDDRQAVAPEV